MINNDVLYILVSTV